VPVVASGNLTWTFPDVELPGEKVAGALEFGTLYNFGFTSDVAPGDRNATLGIHLPGPGRRTSSPRPPRRPRAELSASKRPGRGEGFDLVMHGGTAT